MSHLEGKECQVAYQTGEKEPGRAKGFRVQEHRVTKCLFRMTAAECAHMASKGQGWRNNPYHAVIPRTWPFILKSLWQVLRETQRKLCTNVHFCGEQSKMGGASGRETYQRTSASSS